MDKILNAIKCVNCQEILTTPVLLPCYHSICKSHVKVDNKNTVRCGKCGSEHSVPVNGEFPLNEALDVIIKANVARLDFGSLHREAKKSCETFENLLNEIEILLNDPFCLAHDHIGGLKNNIQIKGEELKLRIDQEMKKLFDRLDDYQKQCKSYVTCAEYQVESQKFNNQLKTARAELSNWIENLNMLESSI